MQLLNFIPPAKAIFFVCLLFASCSEKKDPPKKPTQNTIVDVLVAQPSSITNTIEANGTVVANESVELHPEISGRLTYLYVPEGSPIAKGTLIARVNDADLQATLSKSKVLLDLYEKTEQRLNKLLDVNGINQADYDLAINNVNSTKADINYTQAMIDKTVVKAPFDGVAGLRQVSPGAYVSPTTVIATLQQLDKIKIDFTLPEEYSSLVKKGSLVDVEVDATKSIHRKALIIASEPQVNQVTRNLKVRAILQEDKGNPGAFVKVYITADADTKAIMIPTNAIIPDDKNNHLILVKNGKAVFVNVQTGMRNANNVEITKGVNVGDTVVVTGVLFARPNTALTIRSVKTLKQFAGVDTTAGANY